MLASLFNLLTGSIHTLEAPMSTAPVIYQTPLLTIQW